MGDRPKHKSTYDIGKELGLPVMKPSQLIQHLLLCAAVNKPVLVRGRPGSGKTEISHEVDGRIKKFTTVIRLLGHEPTDLGFPFLYDDTLEGYKRHGRSLPDWFRTHKATLDQYPGGWNIFLDELDKAFPSVQSMIAELLTDRSLHGIPMHDRVWISAAANFAQDKAASYPIPLHVANRFSQVILAPDKEDFQRISSLRGLRAEILSYVEIFPDCLDSYDADQQQNCTARSLASLSPALDQSPSPDQLLSLAISYIGEGHGRQFTEHCGLYMELPTMEQILSKPDKAKIPHKDRTDILCATAAMVGRALTRENSGALITYVKRLPEEFCVFALRDAMRRDPSLKKLSPVGKKLSPLEQWALDNADIWD